jgi:hypothetical protein
MIGIMEHLGIGDYIEKNSHLVRNPEVFLPDYNVCSLLIKREYSPSGKYDLIFEPHQGKNIVTNDGDKYYAQRGAAETPVPDFASVNNRIELQNPVTPNTPAKTDTYVNITSVIVASRKSLETGYPKSNDLDTFNSGKLVDATTYKYFHDEASFNTDASNNVTGGGIHAAGATPISTSPLLSHFNYLNSFKKESTDQLITWVNHRFDGQ